MSDYINTYPNVPKLKHDNSHAPSFLHALKLGHVMYRMYNNELINLESMYLTLNLLTQYYNVFY
jgi:hypothetical protein